MDAKEVLAVAQSQRDPGRILDEIRQMAREEIAANPEPAPEATQPDPPPEPEPAPSDASGDAAGPSDDDSAEDDPAVQ